MWRDYFELTKPRITGLILICTAVGFFFGSDSFHWMTLVHALLGTGLMASGTATLNQWVEAETDAKMLRTRRRPLASHRMYGKDALAFGTFLSAAGLADLWIGVNLLTAMLGLFTLVSYIFVYTPLKRRSPISTTIGAIPGAMPPLIGYAAAADGLDSWALALFVILFIWQFPHFYAIAWMYRDDYARGGIRMLPVVEPDGKSTARRIVLFSVLLIPISLVPSLIGMTGSIYVATAVAGGSAMLYFAWRARRERSLASARDVLIASVIYLPVVLGMMVLDGGLFT